MSGWTLALVIVAVVVVIGHILAFGAGKTAKRGDEQLDAEAEFRARMRGER